MSYKASVIVPVYNAEKTLRRCVESIALGQERDLEIILVDDCSKDASWEICQALKAEFPNLVTIRNERNGGVSFTRNRGLARAQGEYILFVDSDDWVSGKYVQRLLETARQYPGYLPICGLHFIDHVHGEQRDYLWDNGASPIVEVQDAALFDLSERFLLQQLWNKVFRRDLIEKYRIRFDESQSMGEDFQFVLDYLEASGCNRCAVLNEALYYYIRWNTSSLMGTFGFVQNQQEYMRAEQLHRVSGAADTFRRDQMLQAIRQNYVYHIARNPNHSRPQKLDAIEAVMGDGKSRQHYRKQKTLHMKENTLLQLSKLKALPVRLEGRRTRKQRDVLAAQMKMQLREQDFSIISQNCIGGVLYHDMGLQFLSPTVNLYFTASDFVRFVLNLDHYLDIDPVMAWDETYPVGYLEDITIRFMHYNTCEEARQAWQRRKVRINKRKILVLCTDMEDFTEEVFTQWQKIPYPKILYTANAAFADHPDTVFYPQYQAAGRVPDLIPRREFYRNFRVIDILNRLGKEGA